MWYDTIWFKLVLAALGILTYFFLRYRKAEALNFIGYLEANITAVIPSCILSVVVVFGWPEITGWITSAYEIPFTLPEAVGPVGAFLLGFGSKKIYDYFVAKWLGKINIPAPVIKLRKKDDDDAGNQ